MLALVDNRKCKGSATFDKGACRHTISLSAPAVPRGHIAMRRRVKHGAKHGASNYVTARWCFHEGLNVDFFWLGVHCLEKYLKAALLLNGRRTIGYGHNIVKL